MMATSAPPRRFQVEPVETTIKSSKDQPKENGETAKSPRRFAPEPLEVTSKSNRKVEPESVETEKKTLRRFAPEPVETTVKSSRAKFAEEWESQNSKSKEKGKGKSRNFTPLLIETARRSRKADDPLPTMLPSDKTEATPNAISQGPTGIPDGLVPPPPENTPVTDFSHNPLFLEIQRATSPIKRRRPLPRSSQHFFRVPELDPIESSESEAPSPPSPSVTRLSRSDPALMYKDATRVRESVDDTVSGYLLALAAKAAEKQLRDQAMAAFPNDDHHEPVDHFVDHETDDGESYTEDNRARRDSSFSEVNWELLAMRKHRERLEQEQEAEREKQKHREAESNKPVQRKYNPWGNPHGALDTAAKDNVGAGDKKDSELDRMRKDARPPMLGGDIKFPRCPSPEPARFDPTQGCDATRMAMCYLNEQSEHAEKGEGLWSGKGNGSSRPPSRNGLWAGCCVNSGNSPPRGPTGLLTPNIEKGNPLETPCPSPVTSPAMSLMPPTPPASQQDFACIDEKLNFEASIDEDFGDDFVTQVYNYLSLGYPSMARPFDHELSKISKIPLSELRQDDHLATTKGYIRLGGDGNLKDTDITEQSCMRWRALRIYVQEWARQHPGMAGESMAGGMGTAVRRGSWAI